MMPPDTGVLHAETGVVYPTSEETKRKRVAARKKAQGQANRELFGYLLFATYGNVAFFPGVEASEEAIADPSFAYQVVFSNRGMTEPGAFDYDFSMLVDPLLPNTISGELVVELIDANGDGTAFLSGNFGGGSEIQAVRLRDPTTFATQTLGPLLGGDIEAPGTYTFTLSPMAGLTSTEPLNLVHTTRVIISPGDVAHITSHFLIDEGRDIPVAQIPALPDPSLGPYYNVIEVDSPETSLGEDWFIGSQTQLDVHDGGQVAPGFEAGSPNGFDFDIQVNVSGGVIRREAGANRGFRSYAGSEVNVSGGVIEYLVAEHDSVVNVSGGRIGVDNENFDSFEALYVTHDAVANVTGGAVDWISADKNSVVNMSGGTLGNPVDQGIVVHGDSVFNLSGGTVGTVNTNSFLGSPTVNMSGGQVVNAMGVNGSGSKAIISGGSVGRVSASNDGQAVVIGGTITGSLGANTGGEVNLAGGSIAAVRMLAGSELNLFGLEFSLDGAPLDELVYGQPMEIAARDVPLSGLLSDGSSFSFVLHSASMAPADLNWVHPDATLTVMLSLPGDYNNDRVVDAADYTVWRDHLGSQTVLPHDVSPGSVTQADYDVWRMNFGRSLAEFTSAAAVPEPLSGVLFLMGAALLHRLRSGRIERRSNRPASMLH